MTTQLPVATETGTLISPAEARRVSVVAQALSDPIRVKMLAMMAAGRECCPPPENVPPNSETSSGLCVCEFEAHFGMGQSKVSYHVKKLKDAELVTEEKRGRWNYYSVNRETVAEFVAGMDNLLRHPAHLKS